MENDSDNQKSLIKTAINRDDYSKAKKELDKICQEGLVEVALNARNSNVAKRAVYNILKPNQDLWWRLPKMLIILKSKLKLWVGFLEIIIYGLKKN